jgi:glyoxylase-like metal-dependent hydrolase (beta-lactamase superfamily II)
LLHKTARLVFAVARGAKTPLVTGVNLHAIPSGPIQTVGYLLTAPERGEAVLIDAPGDILGEIEPILAQEKCRLTELWITHGHWDHTQDAAKVVRATGAKVRAHAADQAMIERPEIMKKYIGEDLGLEPIKVDFWMKQGDRFEALGTTVEVRHVPGHCPGNILFYLAAADAAFVGDALFNRSIGRTDLPGGNFEMLAKAIREQIYTLPDETTVYPGHGEHTSVGDEKTGNPYVKG